ncbi:hypothetical protein GWK36_10085 [Caldichromatium japonicum]|uniref:Hydrogenase maturation protease n=1 Tax=Caldichromatium japonicum TaxID=2699430 RepID=A0A6G7VEI8_9GAMM|nr:hypothetical protein [Caldichromatium japonicum]QIK38268.1 hypothetical protein GWK36_10085 [Caldichromatium japonicum]
MRGDDAVGFIAAERLLDWLERRAPEGSGATGPAVGYASRTLRPASPRPILAGVDARTSRGGEDSSLPPVECARYPTEGTRPRGSGVEVIARQCLTPELAADLARHRRALFIDAALDDPPGKVRCRRLRPTGGALGTRQGSAWPTPRQDGSVLSPPLIHALTPAELLAWCLWLYGTSPRSSLISIGGESFAYAERLSPVVDEALQRLLDRLYRLIHP